MKKTIYEKSEMEVIELSSEDVIRTSGGGQTPWDPVGLSRNGVDFGNDSGITGGAG